MRAKDIENQSIVNHIYLEVDKCVVNQYTLNG